MVRTPKKPVSFSRGPIPAPEPGLVVNYAYLWRHEHRAGHEEGRKDRPSVIILAAEKEPRGDIVVTVLPITHRPPDDATAAVEIPPAVKKHLSLDEERSWVIVDEGNEFVWPGYDLRRVPQSGKYDLGFLPPKLFLEIREAFLAVYRASGRKPTPRG
jgi:hypothetical protein